MEDISDLDSDSEFEVREAFDFSDILTLQETTELLIHLEELKDYKRNMVCNLISTPQSSQCSSEMTNLTISWCRINM